MTPNAFLQREDCEPPVDRNLSAIQTLTSGQALILLALAFGWVLAFCLAGVLTLIVSIAAITAVYLADLLLNCALATRILTRSPEAHIDDAVARAISDELWPRYTILCPLYREAVIASQFVQAIRLLDYPVEKLQVLLLTEEDDAETRNAILSLDLPRHFEVLTVPPGEPRTKPRACNFGLLKATGEYVVIYDAEDVPDPLQLKKAVLAFANSPPEVACVQAKLNFYNPTQNLLTRWFTAEYSLWFDLVLPALQSARIPIPLGGTSNHFRAAALRQVGGWDPFNVTEDCDLGLRLARYRLQTAILDSTTYEEANSRLKNWLRQRSRWIKGYMQTYLVHMRHPLHYLRAGMLRDFWGIQFVLGARIAMLFINPLMWLLLLLYLVFQTALAPTYQVFYPEPVFYLSIASLILGNFFYLYTNLLGCIRRKQYGLMGWTLLMPLYWALMSVAAGIAFVQLIFKPYFWEKTQHGLHLWKRARRQKNALAHQTHPSLQANQPEVAHLVELPVATIVDRFSTWRMLAIPKLRSPSERDALANLPTMEIAALTMKTGRVPRRRGKLFQWVPWTQDQWLGATLLTAITVSVAACWYSFSHQFILLYEEAFIRLRIARALVENVHPEMTGSDKVWLPLPHILMVPLVWNDLLWRSGLAGSITSMLCYVIAALYVFLSARRLSQHSLASFVGTLAFILNPNVLYLQTTPLAEPAVIATVTATSYYFLTWAQSNRPEYLVWAAAAVFLATFTGYEGWMAFLVCLVLIIPIGWLRRQRPAHIGADLLLFGILGGFGIVLWLLWCAFIFKDPFYFLGGQTASAIEQMPRVRKDAWYLSHDVWHSLLSYTAASVETIGPLLFGLALVALVVWLFRRWKRPEMFGALVSLTPFAFYLGALYTGQTMIFVPGIGPAGSQPLLYNARYGAEMVAPAAIFLATLVSRLPLTRWLLILAILLQTTLTIHGGIIALQDGQYGLSCHGTNQATLYLAAHYHQGRILADIHTFEDFAEAGIDVEHVIYQSAGPLWQRTLKNPALWVDWVMMQPGDEVAAVIDPNSPVFLAQFTLVAQDQDVLLFHRRGLPPLPAHSVPSSLLTRASLCKTGQT
jgi:cellulose synthase/poly-beta-1,6-N-acetylglucosamine synthase-like glycosyltransferase